MVIAKVIVYSWSDSEVFAFYQCLHQFRNVNIIPQRQQRRATNFGFDNAQNAVVGSRFTVIGVVNRTDGIERRNELT